MSQSEDLRRLIRSELSDTKMSSTGTTVMVCVIVVFVILVLFGLLMNSPPGINMIKSLKKNIRQVKRRSTKKLIKTTRKRTSKRRTSRKKPRSIKQFKSKSKKRKLQRVSLKKKPRNVNLTRRRRKINVTDLPQFQISSSQGTQFSSYNKNSSTTPSTVANMSTSNSSVDTNAMSASKIEKGVAQATLANSFSSSELTSVPTDNSFLTPWLHGDVSSSLPTNITPVRSTSVYEELASQGIPY